MKRSTTAPSSSTGARSPLALGLAGTLALGFSLVLSASACGSRSELDPGEPLAPLPACLVDADCDGFDDLCRNTRCRLVPAGEGGGAAEPGEGGGGGELVARCVEINPVVCDDEDECTADTCDPETGLCSFDPLSFDLDEDGYDGPREGYKAGEPGACGDDCDDANAAAFPGNPEICDGVDNDCNGVVDDDASFVPLDAQPVRVSTDDIPPASPSSLAYSGSSYAAVYTGTSSGFRVYRNLLSETGASIGDGQQSLTLNSADSTGGVAIWTGDRYGVAYQARFEGDYEVYFVTVDANGQPFGPPTRISDALGFSVNVELAWTGTRFVVAWQDERDGLFQIYARLVDLDGVPSSPETPLTQFGGFENESPVVAASSQGIGVAWLRSDLSSGVSSIEFQSFGFDLAPLSDRVSLSDGTSEAVGPTIAWNDSEYVVAWFDKSRTPRGIWGAVVGAGGSVRVPAKPVSNPPSNARSRYPAMRALGDRVLFVYSDDRDQNQGYELYSRMLDASLEPLPSGLSAEQRITTAGGDSIYAKPAFGPDGDVGVLFRDDRDGAQHVWFTRLGCFAGGD